MSDQVMCLQCQTVMELRPVTRPVLTRRGMCEVHFKALICPQCGLEAATMDEIGNMQRQIMEHEAN